MGLLKGIRLKLFYMLLSVLFLSLIAMLVYNWSLNYISMNVYDFIDDSAFVEFETLVNEVGLDTALNQTDLAYERADIYDEYGNRILTIFPMDYGQPETIIVEDALQESQMADDVIMFELPETIDQAMLDYSDEFLYSYSFYLEDGKTLILYVPEIMETARQDLYKNGALIFFVVTLFLILLLTSILGAKFFIQPIEAMKKAVIEYEKGGAFDFSNVKDEEFVVLAHSIEEMTKRLHEEEDKRKQLILDLAHDIKTPLTSVMGYTETLKQGGLAAEEADGYLDVIYKNSSRANEIVKNMYDITAMDTNHAFHMKVDNFSELLRESVILHVGDFDRHGLDYNLHIPESDVYALMDGSQMTRVLSNIMSNGCKYLSKGNRMDFYLEVKKDQLVFTYEDDGPGISSELMKRLFDPFVKGDDSRSDMDSKGLGLSITKKIVEAHGGSIVADASYTNGLRLQLTMKTVSLTKNVSKS